MTVKLLMYTLSMLVSLMPVAVVNQKKSELYVLATLYSRHENTPVYDTAKLKQIIEAIKPDVLVLDVSPEELKEGKVRSSKIEYRDVIFPLIKGGGYKVYPAEPGEPMFSEIVNEVRKSINDFKASQPGASAALKHMNDDMFEALKIYWKTPADVNSHFTDQVVQGRSKLFRRLNNIESGDEKWTRHGLEVIVRAIKENPGKRVLFLVGIDSCFEFREILKSNKEINLIDMEKWLKEGNR